MSWILDPLFTLLCLAGLLLLLMALLAPLEALGWWAGWDRHSAAPKPGDAAPQTSVAASTARVFVVYLTAIGGVSTETLSARERRFLRRLMEQSPDAALIDDVFPFSVTNNPLNGERQLAWLWQRISDSRMRGAGALLSGLIFIRNLLQVGVSGDPRYGPIYNVGVAREITRSLLRQGYRPDSSAPICVMGWSGGGQIAFGASRYLSRGLAAPVTVISIGGVLSDDPAIGEVAHLYHLQGSKDWLPNISNLLYPGRWRLARYSMWNQAKRAGCITTIDPGPMIHTGRGDYFDRHTKLPSGESHLDKTVAVVGEIVRQAKTRRST